MPSAPGSPTMARRRGRLLPTAAAGLCVLLATLGSLRPCWGHAWASPTSPRHALTGRRAAPPASPSKEAAYGSADPQSADRKSRSNQKTGRAANFKPKQTKAPSTSYRTGGLLGSAVAGMLVAAASTLLPRRLVIVSATKEDSAKDSLKMKIEGSLKGFPPGSKRQMIADAIVFPPGSKRQMIVDAIVSAVEKAKETLKDSGPRDFVDGVLDAMNKAEREMDKDLEGKTDASGSPIALLAANMYPPIGIVAHDAVARRADADTWEVLIEAWIFRRNEERHKIRLALCQKILVEGRHKIFDVDEKAQRIYEERARLVFRSLVFRGGEEKRILEAKFGSPGGEESEWIPLPLETDSEGRVISSVKIPAAVVERVAKGKDTLPMQLRCVIPDRETPCATAEARLVEPEGILVISDIDDTVKITEVYKGKDQVVRNTFFEEFTAVEGMADLFQSWAKRNPGTSFQFVSNSPPELMEPLRDFMTAYSFPQAPLHLRPLRGKDRKNFKQTTIETIMDQFPERQVALIGDSGEADALIYANIFKAYPGRVARILIREVHESCPARLEYFDGVPQEFWQVFKDSSEIVMPESVFG